MDKKDIILFAAILVALGFSLYRKLIKKNQDKAPKGQSPKSGSLFSTPSRDDDYEPYSKK